jgi:transposase-like protein
MTYWTLDYFKRIYNQYLSSGLSIRDFCKRLECDESRFYYWAKKVKEAQLSVTRRNSTGSFIPKPIGSTNGETKNACSSQAKNATSCLTARKGHSAGMLGLRTRKFEESVCNDRERAEYALLQI